MKKLSEEIKEIFENINSKNITIGDVIDTLSIKGWGIIFLFLSIAGFIPAVLPIFTIPFGIIITLLGIQFLFSRKVYLPNIFRKRKLGKEFSEVIKRVLPILKRIEYFSKPRLSLFQNIFFKYMAGITISLMGLLMAIPIPLTGTIPAIVIFIIGLGLINSDGLFTILGIISGFIILFIFGILIFLGTEALI